eukprot:GHVT01062275.1.p2 GENE.GHVT01062275.1~~GHVT01062275.1.p2  ORF type:complete len:133 (+),score=8.09 GHVT01062275.1:852-1250(+)
MPPSTCRQLPPTNQPAPGSHQQQCRPNEPPKPQTVRRHEKKPNRKTNPHKKEPHAHAAKNLYTHQSDPTTPPQPRVGTILFPSFMHATTQLLSIGHISASTRGRGSRIESCPSCRCERFRAPEPTPNIHTEN